MRCQKCDNNLEHEEYRKVADWFFCVDCFQNLLAKHSAPDAASEGDVKRDPVTEEAEDSERDTSEDKPLTCQVCEQAIGDRPFKKIGIWSFCLECYAGLNQSPVAEKTEDESAADDRADASLEDDAREGRIHINFLVQKTIPCQQCGRLVPEKGMKKDGEKHLCPDCWYALLEKESAAASRKEPEIPSPEHREASATMRCESCHREAPESQLDVIEGFHICRACRVSDMATALEIARKRHRKRLQSLKDEIEL